MIACPLDQVVSELLSQPWYSDRTVAHVSDDSIMGKPDLFVLLFVAFLCKAIVKRHSADLIL